MDCSDRPVNAVSLSSCDLPLMQSGIMIGKDMMKDCSMLEPRLSGAVLLRTTTTNGNAGSSS